MPENAESVESTSANDLPPSVRNSRWWYWIAAVPVFYALVVVFLVVFILPLVLGEPGLVLGLSESIVARLAVALALPSFLITLVLPYALYRDIGLLTEYELTPEWNPDKHEYVILGAAGIFVTGVSFGVAVYYIYQRHVHVGVP